MNRERRLEIKDEPAGGEGGREGEREEGREREREGGREREREGGEEGGREGRRGEGGREREREKNESVNCKVHVEQNKRRQKGERH